MIKGLRGQSVESCDGPGLKAALLAATAWLEQNAEQINALNVFPVPDGDTGSNMWLTLQSAVGEANETPAGAGVGAVAQAASHGALMGARGNSGVILSQILRGLARGLGGKVSFDATDLAKSFAEGATTAYKGVIKPVEGTILTVARESAEAAIAAADGGANLVETLSHAVVAARESLARTPSLLAVLAEAGVVDAGGQGYLAILEGMLYYFRGDELSAREPTGAVVRPQYLAEESYGYCTEFMVQGQEIDIAALRTAILSHGESVLVVGDTNLARIHVHTLDPGPVLSAALQYGTLHKIKIDNMEEQHREFLLSGQLSAVAKQDGGTPTAADAQDSGPLMAVALVAVASGPGLTQVFHSLGATIVVPGGQTMNPSTGELLQAVESSPADAVVLLPNNGNIVLTAQQTQVMTGKRLIVVPTETVPQGVAALMAFNYEADLDTNAQAMARAAEHVSTIEITRAVRAAKLDGLRVREGATIALVDGRLVATGDSPAEVALAALKQADVDSADLVTIYSGEGSSEGETEQLAAEIRLRWPDSVVEIVDGGQPHYPYIISVE